MGRLSRLLEAPRWTPPTGAMRRCWMLLLTTLLLLLESRHLKAHTRHGECEGGKLHTFAHTHTEREKEHAPLSAAVSRPLSCLLSRKGKNAAAALTNCCERAAFLWANQLFVPRSVWTDTISGERERSGTRNQSSPI